jgi:hypothetical protein
MADKRVVAGSSLGFGAMLAIVMSWTLNKSIIWAIIHGILGWIYVIYYMIAHNDWKLFWSKFSCGWRTTLFQAAMPVNLSMNGYNAGWSVLPGDAYSSQY